jgi:CBS domain-containing protein
MGYVSSILATKGSQVHVVAPDSTVFRAVEAMVRHNIGSLVVTRGEEIAGIFTERDHLRRVTLQDRNPHTTTVAEVMTERVIVVQPTTSIEECMDIMTRERIRHLPVVERGRVTGMISIGDLVKRISREQEVEIRSLTDYITGNHI